MQLRALDAGLKALLPVTRVVDAYTTWMGKRLAWLILAAVVVSAANASVRKIFDTSSNSWLELQWVLFSIVFLLVLFFLTLPIFRALVIPVNFFRFYHRRIR